MHYDIILMISVSTYSVHLRRRRQFNQSISQTLYLFRNKMRQYKKYKNSEQDMHIPG